MSRSIAAIARRSASHRACRRSGSSLELADRSKTRRIARIGADPLDGRIGDLRSDVVEHEIRNAVFERSARDLHADRAAHRSSYPAEPVDAELVDQAGRQRPVERERIFLLRLRTPLTQAAPDGVGTDDAITAGEMFGEVVEVTAGAGEPVPHHHDVAPALAPFDVVELAGEHRDILRGHNGHLRATSLP